MPGKSPEQRGAAGAALAAKRGDAPKSSLKGASKEMEKDMSEKELSKMASKKNEAVLPEEELVEMIMEAIMEGCGKKHKLEEEDEVEGDAEHYVAEPVDEVKVDGCKERINPVEPEVMSNCKKATAGTKGDHLVVGSGGAAISETFMGEIDQIIQEEFEKLVDEGWLDRFFGKKTATMPKPGPAQPSPDPGKLSREIAKKKAAEKSARRGAIDLPSSEDALRYDPFNQPKKRTSSKSAYSGKAPAGLESGQSVKEPEAKPGQRRAIKRREESKENE